MKSKEGIEMYKICECCGKEFLKKATNQKFCSGECSEAVNRERARARYKKKTKTVQCKFCGAEFLWSFKRRDYCCDYCKEAAKLRREEKRLERYKKDDTSQPCWTCQNYINGCRWSRELKPVPGWVAERVIRQEDGEVTYGYRIEYCPEYKGDEEEA